MNLRGKIKKFALWFNVFPALRGLEQVINAYKMQIHEPDYLLLPESINGGEVADIGANIGQSMISFRKLFPDSKIHCFEPNPACINLLNRVAKILGGEIVINNIGLGNTKGSLAFYVPTIDGVEVLQEGSFEKSIFRQDITKNRIGGEFRIKELNIGITELDSFNMSVSLIKIDVQGLEYEVIEGASETILKYKPVVIVENDRLSKERIETKMAEWGYTPLTGVTNTIYVYAK